MASADFFSTLIEKISPSKVLKLSTRAIRFYLVRLSVTVGFRVHSHAHRPHPASLSVRIPMVVSLLSASFRLTSRFPPCGSLWLLLLPPVTTFQVTSFSPCRAHEWKLQLFSKMYTPLYRTLLLNRNVSHWFIKTHNFIQQYEINNLKQSVLYRDLCYQKRLAVYSNSQFNPKHFTRLESVSPVPPSWSQITVSCACTYIIMRLSIDVHLLNFILVTEKLKLSLVCPTWAKTCYLKRGNWR